MKFTEIILQLDKFKTTVFPFIKNSKNPDIQYFIENIDYLIENNLTKFVDIIVSNFEYFIDRMDYKRTDLIDVKSFTLESKRDIQKIKLFLLNQYKHDKEYLNTNLSIEEIYALERVFDLNEMIFLGSGSNGKAFSVIDERDKNYREKVIKSTTDYSEINLAKQLMLQDGPFAKIFDVAKLGQKYIILLEKLDTSQEKEIRKYIEKLLNDKIYNFDYDSLIEKYYELEDALSENEKKFLTELLEIFKFFNVIMNINEFDIWEKNLGYDKNGVLKIFDVSVYTSYNLRRFVAIKEKYQKFLSTRESQSII